MAINVGEVITYSDLVKLVLDSIQNRCQNIDYLRDIPSTLVNSSYTINGRVDTTLTNDGLGAQVYVNNIILQDGAVSYKVEVSKTNNPITIDKVPVPLNTVRTQLNEFLESRGIAQPKETIMTQRGILNFFVNVASFVKTKVVMFGNDLTADTAVVYVPDNKDIPDFPRNNSNLGDVEPSKLSKENVSDMIEALARITNYQQIYYDLTVNCCSSSSSSSSSSCSSSSSSSIFIAYLMI
jgi:hypothetical protein